MLRCARCAVRRTGPLLDQRHASIATQAQVPADDGQDQVPTRLKNATDLSAPDEGKVLVRKVKGETGVPAGYDRSLRAIIRKRTSQLPRQQLENKSAIEDQLLKQATSDKSYLGARKALEDVLPTPAKTRSAEHSNKRKRFLPGRVDWLPFARRLVNIKKQDDGSSVQSVAVTNSFLQDYTGSIRPNMWIQRTGSGSEVRVLSTYGEDTTDGKRCIILQGSDRAVELAREDIIALQEEHNKSSSQQHRLTTVFTQDGEDHLSVDSVASFTRYVFRLTNERIPRLKERATGKPWHEVVGNKLGKAFSSPETSIYSSTVALNRALAFLAKRTELVGMADHLHNRAKQMGLQMDCTSYNLLLGPAIATNNTKKVNALISEMHVNRTVPNSHTWTLFFSTCRQAEDKATVIQLMEAANVRLTARAKAVIAMSLIKSKFRSMSDSAGELDSLFQLLDQTFGIEWLNSQSYNFMLKTCDRRRLHVEVLPALQKLSMQRKVALDSRATAMLIKASLRKSLTEAMTHMFSLSDQNTKTLQVAISAIFLRAWELKYVNTCRVLWRCAATHGILTWEMRNVVNKFLVRNQTKNDESHMRMAKRLMARIVVGIDCDGQDFAQTFPRLSEKFDKQSDPIMWLSDWTFDDGTRDEQLSLAYVVMHRDLHAHEKYAPIPQGLRNSLLKTALLKDSVWLRRRWFESDTLAILLEHAIPVPLLEKETLHAWKQVENGPKAAAAKVVRSRGYRKYTAADDTPRRKYRKSMADVSSRFRFGKHYARDRPNLRYTQAPLRHRKHVLSNPKLRYMRALLQARKYFVQSPEVRFLPVGYSRQVIQAKEDLVTWRAAMSQEPADDADPYATTVDESTKVLTKELVDRLLWQEAEADRDENKTPQHYLVRPELNVEDWKSSEAT